MAYFLLLKFQLKLNPHCILHSWYFQLCSTYEFSYKHSARSYFFLCKADKLIHSWAGTSRSYKSHAHCSSCCLGRNFVLMSFLILFSGQAEQGFWSSVGIASTILYIGCIATASRSNTPASAFSLGSAKQLVSNQIIHI